MTESPPLATLAEAALAPLQTWADRFPGNRAVGYLCSYVPEEIIHAAGFTPIRIRGTAAPLRHVDGHLQSFTCALCRSTLDQMLDGSLAFLEGTVFAHTCDAMQAQADLWRLNTGAGFVETVMQPANLGTRNAGVYLTSELERFRRRMAAHAGRPIEASDIRSSIVLYNETRELIGALAEMRHLLRAPEFYRVLDAAQAMPRELFNSLLEKLLLERRVTAARSQPRAGATGPRLFLAGAVLDEPRLLSLIEELGAQVVGDDLCTGSRHFYGRVEPEGDLVSNLARYYLDRPPCPTKYHPDHDPGSYLLEQVESVQAQGVVFALEKFCEPHAFDFAGVQPALDGAGLPRLLLEMEQTPSLEALRTRLQAFIEML
jgi:bcr-type benzoyl-CoA reductase subunit C